MINPKCTLCTNSLKLYNRLSTLTHIASDQSWVSGKPLLGWCDQCGLVQRPTSKEWVESCQEIYLNYDRLYPERLPEETRVLTSTNPTEGLISRSQSVIKNFLEDFQIPEQISWLDYGCGSGDLLETCKQLAPGTQIYGFDVDERGKTFIESTLEGTFFHDFDSINTSFDVISLSHVLEHISNPITFLRMLRPLLAPSGKLLIQVPNFAENPFDLIIYDHALFFQPETLAKVISAAGFRFLTINHHSSRNEITAVFECAASVNAGSARYDNFTTPAKLLEQAASFLESTVSEALQKSSFGPIFIFGAGNGGSWLANQIGVGNVSGFYDENIALDGTSFHGLPVSIPSAFDPEKIVIGLPPNAQTRLKARYAFV
jgi:SAM-dependent methyltransferase